MKRSISAATLRKMQEANNVMRDHIGIAVYAPHARQELGHHVDQNRAKDVQPDSSLVIICLVSIVQPGNFLSRIPVHAESVPLGKFRNRSQNHALPVKPEAMRTLSSIFARSVRLDNTPERKRLRVPHVLREQW
jgi:hypothetical protein